ncbi:MAG: glycosyltransferase [Flavobacterium sp.]|nr:glycosyltransferase [Flavobacterium sp.]
MTNKTKVLFVHDGPIARHTPTGHWYGDAYNDALRQRYLYLGTELTFLMRVKDVTDRDLSRYSRINDEHFSVVEAPNHKSVSSYFKNKSKAKQIVKEQVQSHDAIVIRLPSALGNFAVLYAEQFGKPYLVEVVACPWNALWNHSFAGKVLAPFKYRTLQRNLQRAKYAIYVTTEFLQKRYPTKGMAIGLSDVEIQPGYDIAERLAHISSKPVGEPYMLSTVGAVNMRYKGHRFVLRAIADLKKEGYGFQYHIVGGGDGSELLEEAKRLNIEESFVLKGKMQHDKIFNWLEEIDLYIQPSETEGLPRALVEAMSRGCPSIGSDAGGIPELLDRDFIFANRNVAQLKSILRKLSKERLRKQALLNYTKAQSFAKDELDRRRKDFYDTFLEQNNISKNT